VGRKERQGRIAGRQLQRLGRAAKPGAATAGQAASEHAGGGRGGGRTRLKVAGLGGALSREAKRLEAAGHAAQHRRHVSGAHVPQHAQQLGEGAQVQLWEKQKEGGQQRSADWGLGALKDQPRALLLEGETGARDELLRMA
jgi:hypothetical protein